MSTLNRDAAQRLFGDDLLDHGALRALLGDGVPDVPPIPFDTKTAEAARETGCLLVYRTAALPDGRPLTLAHLAAHVADRGDGMVAFAGEDPWFVDDEVVNGETPEEGWALVAKAPWPETVGRTFAVGEAALARRAAAEPWRRRRAVEIALDTLTYAAARGVRLLADRWDWSATRTRDGGLVNVGGFTEAGLEVLSYSRAVKHGALGICPTLVGHARG